MVVEGYDKSTKTIYKVVFDSIGQFLFVKLKRTSHSVSLLSWKQEYDTEFIQKLDENGNSLTKVSVYLTTNTVNHKLVKRAFTSNIKGEEVTKTFYLENKIRSEGSFPKHHFRYWIF